MVELLPVGGLRGGGELQCSVCGSPVELLDDGTEANRKARVKVPELAVTGMGLLGTVLVRYTGRLCACMISIQSLSDSSNMLGLCQSPWQLPCLQVYAGRDCAVTQLLHTQDLLCQASSLGCRHGL